MSSTNGMARLMNLMRAFRDNRPSTALSYEEESVLAYITDRINQGLDTTVSDLVASQFFGTPPTVQRKVDRLVAANFLVLIKCARDSRKQNLTTTPLAREYFEDLSRHLAMAVVGCNVLKPIVDGCFDPSDKST